MEIDFCPSMSLVATSLVIGKRTDRTILAICDIRASEMVEIWGSMS